MIDNVKELEQKIGMTNVKHKVLEIKYYPDWSRPMELVNSFPYDKHSVSYIQIDDEQECIFVSDNVGGIKKMKFGLKDIDVISDTTHVQIGFMCLRDDKLYCNEKKTTRLKVYDRYSVDKDKKC